MHVVGFGLALMFLGAFAVLCALAVERRRRRALEQESWVTKRQRQDDDDDEPVTTRGARHEPFVRPEDGVHERPAPDPLYGGRRFAPPREATSPWSPTAVDDAQLDPMGQGLALAPGRHTIIVVCSDCAKARVVHKQLTERESLASIVALPEDEPPLTSAVFPSIDPEPLRQAHGGRTTPPAQPSQSRTKVPRHAADPWDFAHHDRRRR